MDMAWCQPEKGPQWGLDRRTRGQGPGAAITDVFPASADTPDCVEFCVF